jgi:hypothetical protein
MSRVLTGIASLGLVVVTAAPAAAATAERRTVCFSVAPDGSDNVVLLEFTSRGRFSMGVTGVFATTLGFGGDPPGTPVAGAARLRSDGKLEFSVTGMVISVPASLWGILDPPGFNAGNGQLRLDLEPPAIVNVDYHAQEVETCQATIVEFNDPEP